ncbi:MAG: hypothetical protein ACFE0J_08830 [Elainellaceae cyanobacterium]
MNTVQLRLNGLGDRINTLSDRITMFAAVLRCWAIALDQRLAVIDACGFSKSKPRLHKQSRPLSTVLNPRFASDMNAQHAEDEGGFRPYSSSFNCRQSKFCQSIRSGDRS